MTDTSPDRQRTMTMIALAVGVVALVLAIVALVMAASDDDDDDDVATVDTTTTAPDSTTTSSTTAPPRTTTSTAVPGLSTDDRAFVVWPFPDAGVRYDDPVEAATEFATELVGFTDPIIGPFQQGDSRSGEVEVRANATGPVTTVMVRQFGPDDSWWVLGSATADIVITDPAPQGAIDDPLQLRGESRAFEGTVDVAIISDGDTDPIGEGFVTGGSGPDMGPFEASIPFDTPAGGWGSVILFTTSAENGQVWQATTVRVGFIGGD